MIPGGTPNPPLRRVVDAPFTSKSHFGLLAVRCPSYMGWGSPLFFFFFKLIYRIYLIVNNMIFARRSMSFATWFLSGGDNVVVGIA